MSADKAPPPHNVTEFIDLANRLRLFLQDSTCCPDAAAQVSKMLLASFVIDIHNGDPAAAAAELESIAKEVANDIRGRKLKICRSDEGVHARH